MKRYSSSYIAFAIIGLTAACSRQMESSPKGDSYTVATSPNLDSGVEQEIYSFPSGSRELSEFYASANPIPYTGREWATITIVSSETGDDGRQEIVLDLTLREGVEVHANPAGHEDFEYLATRISVSTSEAVEVPSEVMYPEGVHCNSEPWGQLNFYRGTIRIHVLLDKTPVDRPLKLRCDVRGLNYRQVACLGVARITAVIP